MTIHAIIELVRYKWTARGRHGIHSPFVYSFIEDVLQNRSRFFEEPEPLDPRFSWLGAKYSKLASRIASYYRLRDIISLPAVREELAESYDLILYKALDPAGWLETFSENKNLLRKEGAVLIPDIHNSRRHSEAWQLLCNRPDILMSLDMFGVGLLFFKEDFLQPQHFVLRWQG
jgi:hypothetical protein